MGCEFAINGLRNRDLQTLLPGPKAALSAAEKRRRSARISRQLRMLRAHGIIRKVPLTHRCQVTTAGRRLITTIPHCESRQYLPAEQDRRMKIVADLKDSKT